MELIKLLIYRYMTKRREGQTAKADVYKYCKIKN